MTRRLKSALEIVSDIGSKAFDLQHHNERDIIKAVALLREVNGPLFDWLAQMLIGGTLVESKAKFDTTSDGGNQPAAHLVELAIEMSCFSPCRSKRGSVIFRGEDVVSHGRNFKPDGFECDGSAACKATCRAEAVHAEQDALLAAGWQARGSEMLHVKTVNGRLVASGGPSCAQCSKLALAAGITAMWLFHQDGWRRYDAAEWHRLSLQASRTLRIRETSDDGISR